MHLHLTSTQLILIVTSTLKTKPVGKNAFIFLSNRPSCTFLPQWLNSATTATFYRIVILMVLDFPFPVELFLLSSQTLSSPLSLSRSLSLNINKATLSEELVGE